MTPHTLGEQKALLTAEAEGRVIRYVEGGHVKTPGVWRFDCERYEVERPLMERWVNEYPHPEADVAHLTEESARLGASSHALRIAVHLREVR